MTNLLSRCNENNGRANAMRYTKHKHVVRGIAARPSESTGKSTGCESHKAT